MASAGSDNDDLDGPTAIFAARLKTLEIECQALQQEFAKMLAELAEQPIQNQ